MYDPRIGMFSWCGVELPSDLSWKIHISNIKSKAERILSLLGRHLYGCKQEVTGISLTCPSMCQIILISLWPSLQTGHFGNRKKIQRKGARFVTGNYSYKETVSPYLMIFIGLYFNNGENIKDSQPSTKRQARFFPVIIPEYVNPFSVRTKKTIPGLCTISSRLRAIQEQSPISSHQRKYFLTTRPCACGISRRVHRQST